MAVLAPFERYGDDKFTDGSGIKYYLNELGIDEYFINFIGKDIKLYQKHIDCSDCDFQEISNLTSKNTIIYFKASTLYDYKTTLNEKSCFLNYSFGEFGIYNAFANNCTVEVLRDPVNIYFPILSVIIIYSLIFLSYYGFMRIFPSLFREVVPNSDNAKKRIQSLDTFRGITILLMIFANFGSGAYYSFEHATWNGIHGADIIFPCFIWIMGAVIPITLPSKLGREKKGKIIIEVFFRSAKLFLLGIFIGGGGNLYNMRIMGVLQRFGISYFVATIILIYFLEINNENYNIGIKAVFKDILVLWKVWSIALTILVIHCLIVFFVHAIDCPSGYFGPGGLHNHGNYSGCVGGATGYLDRSILGCNHVYQKPTIHKVFLTDIPFDPEGLIGCFTTIFHVFIGVQAGSVYNNFKNDRNASFKILSRWLFWAICTGLIGGILCGFSKDEGVIPVNKNLWSFSFVLVTSSVAFVALSILYFLIDHKKWWSGKPFIFAGMNAIVLYAGHEMTDGHFPIRMLYNDPSGYFTRNTHFGAMLSDVWGSVIWLFISYILYRKKIFISL